jgi:site-specific DNA recombinase
MWYLGGREGGAMRAAIYARLSEIDDPANADVNLEQQAALGRKFAEGRGWEIVDTYIEPGRSAFHDERRKVFPRLLADINEGKVDVVVVRHVDRLYRNLAKAAAFRQFCHVAAYDQGIDTTTGDPLPYDIHSVLAEAESRTKSRRGKAWRQRLREQGRTRVGGPRPWGFEPDGVTPRPAEYDVIRRSILAVASGSSIRQAVRMWQDAGLRGRKGQPIAFQSVKNVLARGEEFDLAPDIAERVRSILADPRRKGNRNGSNRRTCALTGIIYCACGTKMSGIRQGRRRVPSYRCNVAGKVGGEGRHAAILATVDELVLEAVLTSDVFKDASAPDPANINRYDEALLALEARESNKRADYGRDLIDAATLRAALDIIDAERQALERERANVARTAGAFATLLRDVEQMSDFDWKRNAIRSVVERVIVRPSSSGGNEPQTDRITIVYHDGRREGGRELADRLRRARQEYEEIGHEARRAYEQDRNGQA